MTTFAASALGIAPNSGPLKNPTFQKVLNCPNQASAASQAYKNANPFDPLGSSIKGSALSMVQAAVQGAFAGARTGAVATIPFGPAVEVGEALDGAATGAIFGAIRGAITGPLTNYIKTQAFSAYIYGSTTLGCW